MHAADNVTLNNSSTTVLGNVYAGGNVTMTGHVKGNVQAGGTISGGTVDGTRAQNSPPAPPAAQTLPTFTWDPANYRRGLELANPAAFQTYWNAHQVGLLRHPPDRVPGAVLHGHRLQLKWTLTGDTTIVADGRITLSRDIANAAGQPSP